MPLLENQTRLTDKDASSLFGEPFAVGEDFSLAAIYRAIVIKHNPGVSIDELKRLIHMKATSTMSDNFDAMVTNELIQDKLMILQIRSQLMDRELITVQGWETFDKPPLLWNKYLSQFTKTKMYVNKEAQRVIIFWSGSMSTKWQRAVASTFGTVLSWYYPQRTDEINSFFKSISVDNPDVSEEQYVKIVTDFANEAAAQYDFRSMRLESELGEYSKRIKSMRISEERSSIRSTEDDIKSYTRRLADLYERVEDMKYQLKLLENDNGGDDNELVDFFKQHKNITFRGVDGRNIMYSVVDTLEFYDMDELKRNYDNPYSTVNNTVGEKNTAAIKELLLNKRGLIRVEANFVLSTMRMIRMRGNTQYENNTMPNPHIYYHECGGGNNQYYSEYAEHGEWQLGVEQSIAATKNWNVGDTTVTREMLNWITGSNRPFIWISDGSPVARWTPDLKLVTYDEFKKVIGKKLNNEEKQKESEEANGEENIHVEE